MLCGGGEAARALHQELVGNRVLVAVRGARRVNPRPCQYPPRPPLRFDLMSSVPHSLRDAIRCGIVSNRRLTMWPIGESGFFRLFARFFLFLFPSFFVFFLFHGRGQTIEIMFPSFMEKIGIMHPCIISVLEK